MLFFASSMAETVVVIGSGTNREAAINDAKRNAVEKVVGSYISSTTVVNNSYVLKDEIYSKAYIEYLDNGKLPDWTVVFSAGKFFEIFSKNIL